jgi:membrane-associated protease RseP (regulator of RpoE activity)
VSTPPPPPYDPGDDPSTPDPLHVRWSEQDQAWTTGPLTPAVDAPVRIGSRGWVHLLLLVITFLTMTWAGSSFFLNYVSAVGTRRVLVTAPAALVGGLWFSVPALLILGAHELGHYFACRYYRIPASLPYFVPAFIPGIPGLWSAAPTLVGTLGAVIRMALPRTRRALFDVGIAGPLAGFIVLVPLAMYGVAHSYAVRLPHQIALQGGLNLGDPLLLTLLQSLYFGTLPDRSIFVMHPTGFAAWFGLLATALNLFPAGQLDGGHIVHAIVGRRSRYVTMASLLTMLGLTIFVSTSWIVWTALVILMAYSFGIDHPPVGEEHVPIGTTRLVLAVVAVAMFALSFTPVPISPMDFVGGR